MKPTEEQWKLIKDVALDRYCGVKFLIDGYAVKVQINRVSDLKLALYVSVDGKINAGWMDPRNSDYADIQKRFLKETKVPCIRSTAKNIRIFGKKYIKDINKKKTLIMYDVMWNSFKSLRRHLVSNNDSIVVTGPDFLVDMINKSQPETKKQVVS